MSLVTQADEVRALLKNLGERGVCLLSLGTENTTTTEAILEAASAAGKEAGVDEPPVAISFTATYEPRAQLALYTCLNDPGEGFLAARDDIRRLTREDGPYGHLKVMVHLDHAHPDRDAQFIEAGAGFFASVMFDCSHLPLAENMTRTVEFVRRVRHRIVIEGAVDEISEAGGDGKGGAESLSSPEVVARYVENTGVDLVVCNLGTEHRATAQEARYDSPRARRISARVGKILVLHGTSSLGDGDLGRLADDGVLKANMWTRFETVGGQAVASDVVRNLGRLLPRSALLELLKERATTGDRLEAVRDESPSLDYLTETHRRREVWMPAVVQTMKECMLRLGLGKLGKSRGHASAI